MLLLLLLSVSRPAASLTDTKLKWKRAFSNNILYFMIIWRQQIEQTTFFVAVNRKSSARACIRLTRREPSGRLEITRTKNKNENFYKLFDLSAKCSTNDRHSVIFTSITIRFARTWLTHEFRWTKKGKEKCRNRERLRIFAGHMDSCKYFVGRGRNGRKQVQRE